jgi:hypothetical protein
MSSSLSNAARLRPAWATMPSSAARRSDSSLARRCSSLVRAELRARWPVVRATSRRMPSWNVTDSTVVPAIG